MIVHNINTDKMDSLQKYRLLKRKSNIESTIKKFDLKNAFVRYMNLPDDKKSTIDKSVNSAMIDDIDDDKVKWFIDLYKQWDNINNMVK